MIKVVWIFHFSNEEVREHQLLRVPIWEKIIRKLKHMPAAKFPDFAVWNSNAIHEFENFHDVELHVIAPVARVKRKLVEFDIRGIHYHFYRTQESTFTSRLKETIFHKTDKEFRKNRAIIKSIIDRVQPQIVHMFGAENPYYSLSLLDIPKSIPTILQLDTLVSDPDIIAKYPDAADSWKYRGAIEQQLIKRADYIATTADKFINIIRRDIKSDISLLPLRLSLSESVNLGERHTKFDFVYFAASINKAFDLALEAFGIAYKTNPQITLDVIGAYDEAEKLEYDSRIAELGLSDAIVFEGHLPTHDDVLKQIRLSRFALLPLRTDLTPGTIRESMANGLPVITTNTGELGTMLLNKEKECALISETGDHQALAYNMLRLLNDKELEASLRKNGFDKALSNKTNDVIASEYRAAYYDILGSNLDMVKG